MNHFVLVPGAGGAAWYWHRVVPMLQEAGSVAVAVDLPGDDPKAGLDVYAERVIAAIGDRSDVVLVAQSMGGFTAALVGARVSLRALVFVNAMIPVPDETAGEWWGNTGAASARVEAAKRGGYGADFDVETYFLHDLPKQVTEAASEHARPETEIAFGQP